MPIKSTEKASDTGGSMELHFKRQESNHEFDLQRIFNDMKKCL